MDINTAFPSTYLKAADLQKRSVVVTIERIEMEKIGDDHKPIIYFQGKDRGLVVNKTNANNIAYMYGAETDGWIGQRIELYPTMVDFQGRSVEAIRVRPTSVMQQGAYAQPQKPAPPASHPNAPGNNIDDSDIPF